MKRILFSIGMLMIGSVYASQDQDQDWRVVWSNTRKKAEVQKSFFRTKMSSWGSSSITREDIRDGFMEFDDFLEWKNDFGVPVGCFIAGQDDRELFECYLGFSPKDLEVSTADHSSVREIAQRNLNCNEVLGRYDDNPWRHTEWVFTRSCEYYAYTYDGKDFNRKAALEYYHKESPEKFEPVESADSSYLATLFDKKIVAGIGILALSGILYRYYGADDKKK